VSATVVWFRQDLRIDDHTALLAAAARKVPIVPLFVWAPDEEGAWAPGAASRWWLHQSLAALAEDLKILGSPLVIRSGSSLEEIQDVVKTVDADAVYWSRRYEPESIARDTRIKAALSDMNCDASSFNASSLFEPWTIRSKTGGPYRVFTPYWRACLATDDPPAPKRAPRSIEAPATRVESDSLESLALRPTLDWADGIDAAWTPGETGAERHIERLVADVAATYDVRRDRPDVVGTSRLSPHLHFGEVSPRRVWHTLRARAESWKPAERKSADAYLRQLVWREFALHLLFHEPHTPAQPLREEFARFPWRRSRLDLEAWQRGRTGYPIVDAGMRELWATGWMHNRVRMVVGSFLVKHLLLPWQEGAAWFWDTLVDADLANNTMGWQWIAGSGADAAPYFRVFNPMLQAAKFDPDGSYIKRWVPELADLSPPAIFAPWAVSRDALSKAGVVLGKTYPKPRIEHGAGRKRALDAYAKMKGRADPG
jgi:deoxyribodipyrimidine photo-lyase